MFDHSYFYHREIMQEGVNPNQIEYFLRRLNEDKEVPPLRVMGKDEYEAIVHYFQQEGVLNKNKKVNPEGLENFTERISQEINAQSRPREKEEQELRLRKFDFY